MINPLSQRRPECHPLLPPRTSYGTSADRRATAVMTWCTAAPRSRKKEKNMAKITIPRNFLRTDTSLRRMSNELHASSQIGSRCLTRSIITAQTFISRVHLCTVSATGFWGMSTEIRGEKRKVALMRLLKASLRNVRQTRWQMWHYWLFPMVDHNSFRSFWH